MRLRPSFVNIVFLACLLAFLSACRTETAAPPKDDDGDEVVVLSVTPNEGPPGTLVEVTGLTPELALGEELSASLGGEPLALLIREDGALLTNIPLYLAEDGWPAPPTGPQTLLITREGKVIGEAKDALNVTELKEAPGAAEEVEMAAVEIVNGIELLFNDLSMEPGVMAQYRYAILYALRGLVVDGENSLQAVLDGSAPLLEGEKTDMRLTDALLASSGVLAATQEMAERVGRLAGAGQSDLATQGVLCTTFSPDAELACDMQLYVVLKDFGAPVISDTAATFGQTVGTFFGGICLDATACAKPGGGATKAGRAAYIAAILSAILTVADFTVNKVAVGLLPAKLTGFELSPAPEFEEGNMRQGETLVGIVKVSAANDPPSISLNDLIGSLLSLIGARSPGGSDPFEQTTRELLGAVAEYAANLLSTGLSSYADAHPKLNLDIELSDTVPSKTWGPIEITEDKLIETFSRQPDILDPTDSPLGAATWLASDENTGEARVYAETAGNDGKIIDYSGYTGGAFGHEQERSEELTLCVDGPTVLTSVSVTPETIAADTEINQTYTLTYEDECANLEIIRNEVRLLPQGLGDTQEVGVDADFVAGFTDKEGEGYWVAEVFVSCDYADGLLQGSKRNGFTLEDDLGQMSETLYTYTTVDYSGCED